MLTPEQRDTLIRTAAGEAATEGEQGWAAVLHVIRNRSGDGRWPSDPANVAKQPKQFSAWNKGAGGNSIPRNLSAEDAIYLQIGNVVDGVFGGVIPDPTDGAVFYYAPAGMDNAAYGTAGIKTPKWLGAAAREGPPRTIGNHVFVGKARQFATTPAAGAQAARGLQNYLPGSQVPQPRLRPQQKPVDTKSVDPLGKQRQPFAPGPLLSEQRDRPPGTPPVPPLGIPDVLSSGRQLAPVTEASAIPAGPFGADAVLKAAMTGRPYDIQAEARNVMNRIMVERPGVLNPFGNDQAAVSEEIQNYFSGVVKTAPGVARTVQRLMGDPVISDLLGDEFSGALKGALRGLEPAPLFNAVPIPALRPQTAAPVPMSFAAPAAPPSFPSVWGQQPSPSPTSDTPFSLAPANLTGRGAGSIVPYGPPTAEPRGVLDQITDLLGGLFGGGATASPLSPAPLSYPTGNSTISPELGIDQALSTPPLGSPAYNATVAGYRPMMAPKPAPIPTFGSSPASGARAASGLQGLSWTYAPTPAQGAQAASGLQGYKPNNIPTVAPQAPQTVKTTERKMVPNPAWAEWQAVTQANPELRSRTQIPPKLIPEMITAAKRVMTAPLSFAPQANMPPSQITGGGRGGAATSGRSATPAYNGGRATSNPYYSSSNTQGGVTVGRNSSGQTSFVSGPSGTFSVNPSAGTYTSLTTGRTFSLGL